MKQISTGILLVVFLFISWGCEKKHAAIVFDKAYIDEIKQSRRDFAHFLAMNHIPGATIAIAKNNKIIYSEGIGTASNDLEVPMTRKNITRIGKVSQIFSCIIYLKLVEEGVLEPDSTVQYYVNGYPATEYRLEIKHLPYHTSGIRRENPNEAEMDGHNLNIQKGLDIFMHDKLTDPPGWFEEFSMFNTNLLGAVMEKATNKNFQRLLKEYITDTLKLNNTVTDDPFITIKGRSDFYDENMLGQTINAPYRDLRYKAPSSGILSNAEDLVKLGMAIIASDYFNDEFRQQLFKPIELYGKKTSTTANGWILTLDNRGSEVNFSSGSVIGGGASIVIYPEEELVIACTTNLTIGKESIPIFEIAQHFLEDPN